MCAKSSVCVCAKSRVCVCMLYVFIYILTCVCVCVCVCVLNQGQPVMPHTEEDRKYRRSGGLEALPAVCPSSLPVDKLQRQVVIAGVIAGTAQSAAKSAGRATSSAWQRRSCHTGGGPQHTAQGKGCDAPRTILLF